MFSSVFVPNLSTTCQSTNHHYQMFFSWSSQILFYTSLIFFSSSYFVFHQWNKPTTIEVEQIPLLKKEHQSSPITKGQQQSATISPIVSIIPFDFIPRVVYSINHEIEKEEWRWLPFESDYLLSSAIEFIHRHVIVTNVRYAQSFKRKIQKRYNIRVITVIVSYEYNIRTKNIEMLFQNC